MICSGLLTYLRVPRKSALWDLNITVCHRHRSRANLSLHHASNRCPGASRDPDQRRPAGFKNI